MKFLRFLVMSVAIRAYCQTPPAVPLTLKQAVDMALAPNGNARVALAQEAVRQSRARVSQARAALLPNVDASVGGQNFTRNLKAFGVRSPLPAVQFPEVVGPLTVFDGRATLSQTVLDFSVLRRLKAARAAVDAASAERESARNQVAEQAARAYLIAQRATAAVAVAGANVLLAEALHKLAVSQKNAGTGTGIEVTRAEVQLANERQRLLVARNDLDRALLQLRRVIGMDMANAVEIAEVLADTPSPPVDPAEAIRTAREQRADWKVQKRREDVARLSHDAVRAERLPSIGAYADAGNIGLELGDTRFTRTMAASLRIPLWDGGRRDARRAESSIQLRQEEIRTQDFGKQVELEVRLAMESLQSAEGQVKVAREGLALAESELAAAQRRYQAGVTTSVEVTDAQARLTRARDNQTAALYAQRLAQIDLASAMGVIHQVIQ